MTQKYVLVADDEPKMRRVLEIALHKMGHQVAVASNGREAADIVAAGGVDLVITDLRMPEMDGIELLQHLRQFDFDLPVIVITAHGTIETAVQAMKHGASDYLLRPFDLETLELAIERVLKGAAVSRHNQFLRQELERGWGDLVGTSGPMQAVYELIRKVGPTKAAVMICGETGTGKELIARAVHNASPRHDRLFVPVNCAAIPAEMLESELFGFEKGAFTGAVKDRIGKFELANEGTLFLDELTEMPIALQAKLLRVLQDNTVERLGSNRRIPLDIRIVAATNVEPREAIAQGKLREDLYYRVNVFSIDLPPLRERKDDIAGLVAHFVDKHGHRRAGGPGALDPAVAALLQGYHWPGNVRELENVIERALILSGGGPLAPQHFQLQPEPAPVGVAGAAPADTAAVTVGPLNEQVEALETRVIEAALKQVDGSKPRAAALLQISERTLWYKLKKYRLQ
ncbi:MAG: sigma-54-dependent Fis family transcriptional regulator [Ideonella sp.]|nr:sigma-54-dependent Fis family transcriptional regulator [Ideonella sp.]